jgi:hypothetical protein
MTTEQPKAVELYMPELTAEEKRHTAEMKVPADSPNKGAEADRIAHKGTRRPEPGGFRK